MRKETEMKILPSPGLILVERERREAATSSGVFIPRRTQEEKPTAIVVHPGFHEDIVGPIGTRLIVKPHCGTDFFWEDAEKELTFLDVDDEVYCKVAHGVIVDHEYI